MKNIFILSFCILPLFSYSQIDKIGYTKSEVISSMDGEPCRKTYNDLSYCFENGSYLNYTFSGNKVISVLYMWEFPSKYSAELDVKSQIAKNTKEFGSPKMVGNEAFWYIGKLSIFISYGYLDGKHYSSYFVK